MFEFECVHTCISMCMYASPCKLHCAVVSSNETTLKNDFSDINLHFNTKVVKSLCLHRYNPCTLVIVRFPCSIYFVGVENGERQLGFSGEQEACGNAREAVRYGGRPARAAACLAPRSTCWDILVNLGGGNKMDHLWLGIEVPQISTSFNGL